MKFLLALLLLAGSALAQTGPTLPSQSLPWGGPLAGSSLIWDGQFWRSSQSVGSSPLDVLMGSPASPNGAGWSHFGVGQTLATNFWAGRFRFPNWADNVLRVQMTALVTDTNALQGSNVVFAAMAVAQAPTDNWNNSIFGAPTYFTNHITASGVPSVAVSGDVICGGSVSSANPVYLAIFRASGLDQLTNVVFSPEWVINYRPAVGAALPNPTP